MALTPEEKKRMSGQQSGERTAVYKLNEVSMSGDDGKFKLREVLAPKNAEGKYDVEDLGDKVEGVILKMRWKLSRYEEGQPSLNSTEYDNKWKDQITVYPSRDKGNVVTMKEKHNLSTQRIVYFYMPKKQQIVRLVVKASALTSDKNPNPEAEKGLFDYIDEFNATETAVSDYITTVSSVFREDKKNKRKSYYAMIFAIGRELKDTEKEKVEGMMKEVHEKTLNPNQVQEEETAAPAEEEYPKDDINPDDIPF